MPVTLSLALMAACTGSPADPTDASDVASDDATDVAPTDATTDAADSGITVPFSITSPDMVAHGSEPCLQQLPEFAECQGFGGDNLNPQLVWEGVPAGTVSLALVMDDVAFGEPLDHWGVWGLTPDLTGIPQGASGRQTRPADLPVGAEQVRRYQGSCSDGQNTYRWRLFALDAVPPDDFGRVSQLEAFAETHAIEIATMCHCPEEACGTLP